MIVHAPNLENKIGGGSALILSLRNSGENPKRFNVKNARKRDSISTQSYFGLRLLANITIYNPNSESIDSFVTTEPARASVR